MKPPFVKVEEKNEKVDSTVKQSTGVPRGVYRFKTHEEADEWMEKMLARNYSSEKQQPPQV